MIKKEILFLILVLGGKVGSTDIFETGYKNYIYLAQDDSKIVGKNPKDNPEAFGSVLN